MICPGTSGIVSTEFSLYIGFFLMIVHQPEFDYAHPSVALVALFMLAHGLTLHLSTV